MAEVVLSAFVQVLLDKLSTAVLSEIRSLRSVKADLDAISTTLSMIQAVIEDAEAKQVKEKAVKIWLSKLKDIGYEMDELLDSYESEKSQFKNAKVKFSRLFSCSPCHNTVLEFKIAKKIKNIRERLDRTARERDMLGLQVAVSTNPVELTARLQSTSLVDQTNVVGRENDIDNIVDILMRVDYNSINRSNVSVLPVVGMGGIGKTTLTQLVYNDRRVKEHFQITLWICVSESFDVMKLTKETLESTSIGQSMNATTNMNKLHEDLSGELKGKLFLLVLDDVWNEDPDKWYSFCSALIGGKRGSKIIVTTRNENVGRIMGGLPPYRLAGLSDTDCWDLFRKYAFVDSNSSEHPNLEMLGKEIVKKLKGLPLAAKALGCLLYSKTDEDEWRNILRSEIWELPADKNNILPALRLSYNHLPPHLKQCFAFCSVFHKDYVFKKNKLVQFWMALGYIQPQGRTRLEEIGSNYFDDLLKRSFFQTRKRNYVMHDSCKDEYYMMHDAIHDLAQSISNRECLRLEDGVKHNSTSNTDIVHHTSYSCSNSSLTSFEVFRDFPKLQTVLLLRGYTSRIAPIPKDLFLGLKWLRILDLNRRGIEDVPYSIGNLKQLRYLGLSYTDIKTLPYSLGQLYNLQTLKLQYCELLREIPDCVTNLKNLRHLEASSTLITKIGRIGRLTALQELEEFCILNDDKFRIRELQNLTELRGHLSIRNLENVSNKEEANQAQLSAKIHLSVMEYIWTNDRKMSHQSKLRDQDVLEGLNPHIGIKEIAVKGYSGIEFPIWFGDPKYTYLETIHLSHCRSCHHLPFLGQLPFLRYLDIGTLGVTKIGHEFKGFPSLKELVITDMPELEVWSSEDDICVFPCLTNLDIMDCPKLRELPRVPPTITRLRISETGIIALPELSVTPSSLLSLQINDCQNLKSLSHGLLNQHEQLRQLEKLTITDCEQLEKFPHECFRSLASLKSLHIYNCPNLVAEEGELEILPNCLEDLQVSSCSSLLEILITKLHSLTHLRNLKIADCESFMYFPDNTLPPSLQTLALMNCGNLRLLPEDLREATSLETLVIRKCRQIGRLPEDGLPDNLREVYISDCPLLTMRCEEGRGADWEKIAHVSVVKFNMDFK